MASPFHPSTKPAPFSVRSLIDKTRAAFSSLPDSRKTATSNNLKYAVEDAALSAFSVFFTQSPFLLVCKPDSHSTLYDWLADFDRTNQVRVVERKRWNGQRHITEHYRYMHHLPLRNSDDTLMLNGCDLTETDENGKQLYRND